MLKKTLLFLIFIIPLFCEATDLKPWFGNEYEAEIRATTLYQNYNAISSHCPDSAVKDENDVFLTLSAEYPFKRYSGEFEATAASTRYQNARWDCFRVTGRYQWISEKLAGDPFSMVTSITLTQPFSRALHDISSFHHGHIEAEADISFGQQFGYPCSDDYIFRWWNVIGMGMADEGFPWIREEFACEYNYFNIHQLRGFVHTLWGTGNKHLQPCYFIGYGNVRHQSVDCGIRYSYSTDCWGTLSIQYARRVYALNFPKNTNLVMLEYYLPFGFQNPYNY